MTGAEAEDVFRAGEPSRRGRFAQAMHGIRRDGDLVAAIALGGGLGSLARYAIAVGLPTQPGRFPWSTFTVNIVGCVLIGVLMVFVTEVWRPGRYARPFLGIGILGGFTTYSTMMLDVRALAAAGNWLLADVYLLSSLVLGLVGVWLGALGSRLLTGLAVRRPKGPT